MICDCNSRDLVIITAACRRVMIDAMISFIFVPAKSFKR
jgi:hypothetical protein